MLAYAVKKRAKRKRNNQNGSPARSFPSAFACRYTGIHTAVCDNQVHQRVKISKAAESAAEVPTTKENLEPVVLA